MPIGAGKAAATAPGGTDAETAPEGTDPTPTRIWEEFKKGLLQGRKWDDYSRRERVGMVGSLTMSAVGLAFLIFVLLPQGWHKINGPSADYFCATNRSVSTDLTSASAVRNRRDVMRTWKYVNDTSVRNAVRDFAGALDLLGDALSEEDSDELPSRLREAAKAEQRVQSACNDR